MPKEESKTENKSEGKTASKEYEVLVNLYMTKGLSKVAGGREVGDFLLIEEGTRFRSEETSYVQELLKAGYVREAVAPVELPAQ